MAIKPNDCVIRIKDLEIGVEKTLNWDGSRIEVPVYDRYWTNFLEHVKTTTDWKSGGWNAYDINFAGQMAKYNAVYKQTKKYDERYIKFKSHRDLTYFVLKWQ
jgi:hypothetical protein